MNPSDSLSPKLAAYEAFSSPTVPIKLDRMHQQLLLDTQGQWIGPMPVLKFLNEFLPLRKDSNLPKAAPDDDTGSMKERQEALVEMSRCSSRAQMCSEFLRSMENYAPPSKTTTGLKFIDSHLYRDRDALNLGVAITVHPLSKPFIPRLSESIMDFANCETWIEVKSSEDWDPFVDPPEHRKEEDSDGRCEDESEQADGDENDKVTDQRNDVYGTMPQRDDKDLVFDIAFEPPECPREVQISPQESTAFDDYTLPPKSDPLPFAYLHPFEANTVKGRTTRAQLASYASATLVTQFRTHLFSIIVCGPHARLIRWDRSCAIVTERFLYTDQPFLFEFFRRFSQLTPTQRGMEENVRPATKEQADMARTVLKDFGCELWLGRSVKAYWDMVDITTQAFVEYTFQGRTYIVPAPHCAEHDISPFGRSTRGRVVVDLQTKKGRYLKDCWRGVSGEQELSEAAFYTRLQENKVKNVAEMEHGGDTGRETENQRWMTASWVYKKEGRSRRVPAKKRIQHVIVLVTIGRSLTTFRTARQLLSCLADAMEGYEEALAKASIMHRDISVGNIVMVRDVTKDVGWRGVLIDWDHSALYGGDDAENKAVRVGTWRFLSVHLGRDPKAYHTPLDDRESCIYVLAWICLHYIENNLTHNNTLLTALAVFDNVQPDFELLPREGGLKVMDLASDFGHVQFPNLQPVRQAIHALCRVYAVRYKERPQAQLELIDPDFAAYVGRDLASLQKELEIFEIRERKLSDPTFIPKILRGYAEHLPLHQEESEKRTDWVDNLKVLKERQIDLYDPDMSDYFPPRTGLMFAYTCTKFVSERQDDCQEERPAKRMRMSNDA